jgi:hypothetical protein
MAPLSAGRRSWWCTRRRRRCCSGHVGKVLPMVLTMNTSASVKRDLDFLSRSRPSTFVDAFLAAATDLETDLTATYADHRSHNGMFTKQVMPNRKRFRSSIRKSQPTPRSSRSIANVLYVAVRLVRVGYLHSRTSHVCNSPSP